MNGSIEHLGRELARQVRLLAALGEEKKLAMQDFKLREDSLRKEINRLSIDVSIGQGALFGDGERG